MATVLNFIEEKERRLQEHMAGKCSPAGHSGKSDKEVEDERKRELLRKQLAERAANNMRIIRELAKGKGSGRPAG